MKKLLLLLLIIPIVFGIDATVGDDISLTSGTPTSVDIKDIVRGDLIKEYGVDYFVVNIKDLPKVGNPSKGIPLTPFLSFEKSDKTINIKQNYLTVDEILIKPNGNVLLIPYSNYLLAENLKVINEENKVIIMDSNIAIKTEELNVIDGIFYLHNTKLPVKIMPYMITYRLRQLSNDRINRLEISSKDDALEYGYSIKTEGKLFYIWEKQMDIDVLIDAVTGKVKTNKPWWTIFSVGEEKFLSKINWEEFYAF